MDALTAMLAERDGPPPEIPAAPEEIRRVTETGLRKVRAADAEPAATSEERSYCFSCCCCCSNPFFLS